MTNGCHIEVNDSFCQMTGYTEEEIIGRTAVELELWVNQEERGKLFQLLTEEGTVRNFEFNFKTKYETIRQHFYQQKLLKLTDKPASLLSVKISLSANK